MDNVSTLYGSWDYIFAQLQQLVVNRGLITHLIIHTPDQSSIPVSHPVLLPNVQFVHLRTYHPVDLLHFTFPSSVIHLGLEVPADAKASSVEVESKALSRSSNNWTTIESISFSLPVSESILLEFMRILAPKALRVRIVLQANATSAYAEQVVAAFGQVGSNGCLGGPLTWSTAPKCKYLEVRLGQVVSKNRLLHDAMVSHARITETIRKSQGKEFRINITF
ncbi:hypothetical protein FRB91_006944 [Serendipita sp. 411]|nr:hypothetical protein FRC19_006740 [Serendipita sp. 401]KAG8839556.1 hypothetical protein FRB91_006944 [Serendipita sp. 411]KAG9022530.1 hypothetical protein FS842_006128 [Serendipita sp. 407]